MEITPTNKLLPSLRVIFMGTPSFAVPILNTLITTTNVIMLVCQESQKKDRHGNIIDPETKLLADKHNIEVFQPKKIKEEYKHIIDANPDIIITCAYGQIIPKEILEFPKYGCINVHGSLLPDLRGGAPIHWAIIKGYKKTGVTVMYMDTKMDSGDIISQREITIEENDNLDTLYEKMSILSANLLIDTLPSIIDKTATRTKQDETKVTYGYNITPEQEKIDFTKSIVEIKNLVRGLCSIPAAYCYLDDKRLKIYDIDISLEEVSQLPGTIIEITKNSIICAGIDGIIKINEIKLEGKKRCLTKDYINGINKKEMIGKVLK